MDPKPTPQQMADTTADRPGFTRPMNREEINALPIAGWNGPVHVVRTPEELAEAMVRLDSQNLLGFDTETRPAHTKGEHYLPSLLQLAAESEVFLFQLKQLGLAGPLRRILSDPEVSKVGVGLAHDLHELQKMHSFQPAGFVDLGSMARKAGIRNLGLRGLAAVLLGVRITKGAKVSNWARTELSAQQIRYAATDAWVGRFLFLALRQHVSHMWQ